MNYLRLNLSYVSSTQSLILGGAMRELCLSQVKERILVYIEMRLCGSKCQSEQQQS